MCPPHEKMEDKHMKRKDIIKGLVKGLEKKYGKSYTIEETVSMTALHCDMVILAGVTVRYTEAGCPVSKQGWGTHSVSSNLNLDRIVPEAVEKALEIALENATADI